MTDVLAPWRPAPSDWDRAAATHLLRRAGFGPRPGDVERALADGFTASVDRVIGNVSSVDGVLSHDERLHAGASALLASGSIASLQAWWMALLLNERAQLRERACLMWHDHFATSHAKVADVRLMHAQNELFRRMGLGDFRELLHAVAVDPAMLVWLDGDDNRRGQPNENFARELMELFCLGIGSYTERDVKEAARAFTGWGTLGRSFAYRREAHDPGEKEIFGERGAFGGDDALDIVLAHEACPRHVARKLLEEFVHPQPSPEETEELASFLTANGWDIGRAIERILRSELFFSPRARRSRIAGPIEIAVATVRALGARVAPKRMARAAEECGQALFRPPSVKGWDGGASWIQASAWIARHNALAALARAHVEEDGEAQVDLRAAFGDPQGTADVARAVTNALLPDGVDASYTETLERAARGAADTNEALALVTALVVTSPEYHLF